MIKQKCDQSHKGQTNNFAGIGWFRSFLLKQEFWKH